MIIMSNLRRGNGGKKTRRKEGGKDKGENEKPKVVKGNEMEEEKEKKKV